MPNSNFAYRYIFTFAIGAGPVTGLIIPELSSSRTRGKIMGFSFSVHWVRCYVKFLSVLAIATSTYMLKSFNHHFSVITFFLENITTLKEGIMLAVNNVSSIFNLMI